MKRLTWNSKENLSFTSTNSNKYINNKLGEFGLFRSVAASRLLLKPLRISLQVCWWPGFAELDHAKKNQHTTGPVCLKERAISKQHNILQEWDNLRYHHFVAPIKNVLANQGMGWVSCSTWRPFSTPTSNEVWTQCFWGKKKRIKAFPWVSASQHLHFKCFFSPFFFLDFHSFILTNKHRGKMCFLRMKIL